MNSSIVLDASALMALIQNEKGSETVQPLLAYSVMSTINIAESLTALQRADIQPQESLPLITSIINKIIPFDIDQAAHVAELYPLTQYKGLSLGDRACIALGIQRQIPIYTADKIWAELQIKDADIRLIR